jgi:PQQ-dependent catabolism-associated beta-propeller protein
MNLLALFALLYVTNERAGSVQAIDTNTDRVVRTARIGNRPRGLAVAPDGNRIYVAVSWWRDDKHPRSGSESILALDAQTLKVVARYPAGTDPECVAVSPDGQRLYLSNEDAGTASIVDVRTGRQRATLVVGTEPEGVTASPDGKWVYVTAETSNVLSVIDAKKEKTVANIFVDPRPRAVIFTRDGARAWATAEIGGTVMQIDVNRQRILRRIQLPAGNKPVSLVLSPDETTLYVATGRGNGVAIIDTKSARFAATVAVGQRVWGIAITPDGRKVYAANSLSNSISVIDTKTRRVVATIPTENGPWGLGVRAGQRPAP